MKLHFSKMHGLGNDFVVFNAIDQKIELSPETYQFIADRRFGIGCDQILLVEPARLADTDFHYRIFNADGREVEQCGNGARCFARFVYDQGLTDKTTINVGTASGRIQLIIQDKGQIRVNMGLPILSPEKIPFKAKHQAPLYKLTSSGKTRQLSAISMGNPHAVLTVDSLDSTEVEKVGTEIQQHTDFPQSANIGFMQIISTDAIRLRVFERGSGETLACGTGACAAMVAGRLQGLLSEQVLVSLPGGELMIEWSGKPNDPVFMSGSATQVFEGHIEL